MNIAVALPPGWRIESQDGTAARVPDTAITLSIAPLQQLPDGPRAYMQQRLHEGLGPDAVTKVVSAVDVESTSGWPVAVVQTQVDPPDGESRIHLFYKFLYHGAVAVVRSPSARELDEHRQAILDVLGTVSPVWDDEIVALGQLWERVGPPRS